MDKVKSLHGSLIWCGVHRDMPAVVGSSCESTSLFVFKDGDWYEYARGVGPKDVLPRECSECGAILPLENRCSKKYR